MADKKFLSRHDVELRLNTCLVKYKKKYYRVTQPDRGSDDTSFILYDPRTETYLKDVIDANSGSFQYQFYDSLGWVPFPFDKGFSTSYYISRAPIRRYKAGLSAQSLMLSYDLNSENRYNRNGSIGQSILESTAFSNMLEGAYEDVDVITKFLSESSAAADDVQTAAKNFTRNYSFNAKHVNIPLNRDWAMRFNLSKRNDCFTCLSLLFGLSVVGVVNLVSREVVFEEEYNNSFYWEKFSETFPNKFIVTPRGANAT